MKTAVILTLLLAVHAPPSEAEKSACRPDALRFCLGNALIMNIPGVVRCLIKNKTQISEACREVLRKRGM